MVRSLPGYTVEGQEPIKTDRTAAEVSEGGISMLEKAEKPSVLENWLRLNPMRKHPLRACGNEKKEGGYADLKVLMVEPGRPPYETEIEGGLKSLQAAVGGDIQATYPFDDLVGLDLQ